MFDALLHRYSRQLTGHPRHWVANYFAERGPLSRELRALRWGRTCRRALAAHRLGDMASPFSVPSVFMALGDRSRDVRSAAVRSVGRLGLLDGVEPIARMLAASRVPRALAAEALIEIGEKSAPTLRTLLHDDDPDVRATAIQLLGLVGGPADAPLVAQRLSDGAAEVRAKACRTLGRIGGPACAEALRKALGDRIPFVRVNAANGLASLGDKRALPLLVEQARNDEFDPARAAARAVTAIDPQVILTSAGLPDPGPYIREEVGLVLAGHE
jgi:HEAT repeat protein